MRGRAEGGRRSLVAANELRSGVLDRDVRRCHLGGLRTVVMMLLPDFCHPSDTLQ